MKLMNYLSAAIPVILFTMINADAFAGGMGVTRYHTTSKNAWIRRQPPPYGMVGVYRDREYDTYHSSATAHVVSARMEPPLVRKSVSRVLTDVTHFDFDRSTLKPAGEDAMVELLASLQGLNPGRGMGRFGFVTGIELIGHTDSRGSHNYNDRLGERRAAAVLNYLESQGIRGANVTISSQGKRSPIASNDTDEGRAMNRRTEVIIHVVTVPDLH